MFSKDETTAVVLTPNQGRQKGDQAKGWENLGGTDPSGQLLCPGAAALGGRSGKDAFVQTCLYSWELPTEKEFQRLNLIRSSGWCAEQGVATPCLFATHLLSHNLGSWP